jgi:hypothetical protein
VLCNFASVDRLSLLEKVLDGRGRWTQAVAAEAEQSARFWPKLHQVPVDGWLGDPIEIDDPAETARHGASRAPPTGHSTPSG